MKKTILSILLIAICLNTNTAFGAASNKKKRTVPPHARVKSGLYIKTFKPDRANGADQDREATFAKDFDYAVEEFHIDIYESARASDPSELLGLLGEYFEARKELSGDTIWSEPRRVIRYILLPFRKTIMNHLIEEVEEKNSGVIDMMSFLNSAVTENESTKPPQFWKSFYKQYMKKAFPTPKDKK